MAPQMMHSLPNVMIGLQQLQNIQPDVVDEDELDDTFKLSFQNTHKRSIIESYHCSGFKKMCIVKFVKLPEFTAASKDVSMTSIGSSSSLTQRAMQQGSQQSITQYMSPSGSHQSVVSSTCSLTHSTGDQSAAKHQFSTVVSTPKQIAKTISMPSAGGYSTEVQLARAAIAPMKSQPPTAPQRSVTSGSAPSSGILFQDPFTIQSAP